MCFNLHGNRPGLVSLARRVKTSLGSHDSDQCRPSQEAGRDRGLRWRVGATGRFSGCAPWADTVAAPCRWFAESARWLVLAGKPQQAVEVLRKVAQINGKQDEGEKLNTEVKTGKSSSGVSEAAPSPRGTANESAAGKSASQQEVMSQLHFPSLVQWHPPALL